jgi:hypothetical protein
MKKLARVPVRHSLNDPYWKTPLTYRKDGSPVYPVGGASPDDDAADDDADADDDDADADDDLDAEIDDAVGDDDDADDAADADLTPAEKKLAKRLEKTMAAQLTAATQSIADRLVNAQATAQKKAARAKAAAAASGGTGKAKTADAAPVVDHTPDIRDARATYRELVAGEITFASNIEREAGMKLASAIISQEVPKGTDPDDAGKAAAQQVAATITAIRKDARKNLLLQLQKEGRLVKKEKDASAGTGGGIGGQPNRGGTGTGARTDFQKGADAAARIRPRASTTKTT